MLILTVLCWVKFRITWFPIPFLRATNNSCMCRSQRGCVAFIVVSASASMPKYVIQLQVVPSI